MVDNMDDLKQNFESSFSVIETLGFPTPVKFLDSEIGIGIRKDFDDVTASLIKVGILHPSDNNIEPIYISITHGRKDNGSIVIRDVVKLTDPIDLFSIKNTVGGFFSNHSLYLKDHYYYNKKRNVFLKNSQEITAGNLVQEVFDKHIKTTRPIQGLPMRIKLLIIQVILPALFYTLFYNFFHHFLFIISGDRYTYNMFEGRGETNTKLRSDEVAKWGLGNSINKQLKPKKEDGEKMDIFGYKLSQHAAVMYSLISLGLYFYLYNEPPIKVIETMSNNTLIVLFYVIVTLHFFDKWLPSILKSCIDGTTKIAYYFMTKPIGI